MDEWRHVRLGDVAKEVSVGFVGTMAPEYRKGGIPFLRSQNVDRFKLDLRDIRYIDHEFHERLRKSALRPNDVVTVRTGKPGATAVVPDHLGIANCSDLIITRPGPSLDARWLSYYINSAAMKFIDSQLVGAVQQHFNVGSAKAMVLHLPPLAEQQAIAEVLGALDDKIAANMRCSHGSVELARAIFDREIMVAGENVKLRHLAAHVPGRYLPKSAYISGGEFPVFGSNSLMGWHTSASHAGPVAVLARIGSSCGSIRWSESSAWINNNATGLVPLSGTVPAVLRFALDRVDMSPHRAGSGQPFIRIGSLMESRLEVPSPGRIRSIDSILGSICQLEATLGAENRRLSDLRDALLPHLMSGRLRVWDAEKQLGEVI